MGVHNLFRLVETPTDSACHSIYQSINVVIVFVKQDIFFHGKNVAGTLAHKSLYVDTHNSRVSAALTSSAQVRSTTNDNGQRI